MNTATGNMRSYLDLCKLKIALFSSLSSITGFVLAPAGLQPGLITIAIGVFALACGSSGINQYQEREIDALMPRTEKRPIPSGRITPVHALLFSITLILSGLSALLLGGSAKVVLLGLFAVIWYNGIYTYLKKKSAFAAVPGALVGAIPPAIGWIAGDGSLQNPKLLALCFFFFLWQIPHFWLFVLNHGEEYRKAGLPSLAGVFSKTQLLRILFAWILAVSVSSAFLFPSGIIQTRIISLLLFAASIWLSANAVMLFTREREALSGVAFRRINIYVLIIMALLSLDKLIA